MAPGDSAFCKLGVPRHRGASRLECCLPSPRTHDERTAVSATGLSAEQTALVLFAVRWVRVKHFSVDYLRRFISQRLAQLDHPDLAAVIRDMPPDRFEALYAELAAAQEKSPPP
jgi:hypothetical protein